MRRRTSLDSTADRARLRNALSRWYRTHGRDLPWRRTRDPYAILVSEFMLQQTQVATVLPYYREWMRRFPTWSALSAAPEADVLHAWQGLGYYNRARNLHACAKTIVTDFAGKFPTSNAQSLPGLGRYTANAVAAFAFDSSVPLVEANIARVLTRLTNLTISIDCATGRSALWSAAEALLPRHGARDYNSALMDLGATICTARKPLCGVCPVKRFCRARDPLRLPIKSAKPATKLLTEHHAFALQHGQVLLEQSSGRWRGMWILPAINRPRAKPLYELSFPFTHHRITLAVFDQRLCLSRTRQWFATAMLPQIAMPSPHRRALDALLAGHESVVEHVLS